MLLNEAVLLVECGLIEQKMAVDGNWCSSLQRAAQIMEWLSHKDIGPADAPLHLIAAASCQLAGLPAMALGHLTQMPEERASSDILKSFLLGDFPSVIKKPVGGWCRIDMRKLGTLHDLPDQGRGIRVLKGSPECATGFGWIAQLRMSPIFVLILITGL